VGWGGDTCYDTHVFVLVLILVQFFVFYPQDPVLQEVESTSHFYTKKKKKKKKTSTPTHVYFYTSKRPTYSLT